MIEVTTFLVKSFDLDHLDLQWSLNVQDEESIGSYDFFVLRSVDGAAGPYNVIAGPFHNTYLFRDGDVQQLHKWRNYFYRLRLVRRSDQETSEYGPQCLQASPDRIALEIQRREALLFKEFAGRLVFLYPQLTFGQRCGHCWDSGSRGNTIGRAIQQNCSTCYDCLFVGGFARPMGIYLQIDPSPIQPQRTDLKEHQFVKTSARTWAFPPIRPKDMIVEAENKRWLVEAVSVTEKGRATVRQELSLTAYPKDDIKYKVPIVSSADLVHSPEREFSRPMCIDSKSIDPDIRPEDRLEVPL